MSELQDMLRVQARLHREQGANALGDLFENALNEIELLKKTYNQLFDAVQSEREQLAKANERVKELENCNFDVMAAQAIEQAYLIANAFPKDKAILEALSSVREGATGKLNKFAIEKKIEAVVFYGERLKEIGFSGVDSYTDQVKEMLRKEQE